MKNVFFLLCLGLGSMAFASDNYQERNIPVEGAEDVNCQVRTYFATPTSGGRCHFDDVMTGIHSTDPLRVLCSRLEVRCTRKEDKESN